jgi:hypothetical protein
VECKSCCSRRILYKGDDLRLTICAYYAWEVALNVGLDLSCCNIYDWKAKREIAGDVNSEKAYITNETSK